MLTKLDLINSKKKAISRPDDSELRRLPYKNGYIYGRVSSLGQVRDSKESIREIARLVTLAKEDGYVTGLNEKQVEEWLKSISSGDCNKGVIEDGQVTVDVQDLGISGQLAADERKGLASMQKRINAGEIGAVYVTEGVSRLSRDRDHILPFILLKQLKEYQVRLRTPEGIWNPAIERDWEYLADEFDAAIGELKIMNKRLQRRKAQKAARGEFVGEPVPPGFIVPITGQKPNGQYEYGKLQPYPPHAEIDEQILRVFIKHGGSVIKTLRTVNDLVYPFFPTELGYMERLSSLRKCKRDANGYQVSPNLVAGLATNPKMIGIWQWGSGEVIADNHPPAISEELFLEAFQLATRPGKPKGRAAASEPLEWSGIIYCLNHPTPRRVISRGASGYYSCDRDYKLGKGPACFYKQARFIDEPLTQAVLGQLELNACIEEIISRMESEAVNHRLEQVRGRQQISRLEREIKTLQALLPCCVNEATGEVDREKENYYWEQIREKSRLLEELRSKSVTELAPVIPDYAGLRDFLRELPEKWETFSRSLRNRFLKALIERVELKGENKIEATIIWKAGFRQKVLITRWGSKSFREKLWTVEEDKLLTEHFPYASRENILKDFPVRSWKAIVLRAKRLNIRRNRRIGFYQEQHLSESEKENQTPKQGYQNLKLHQGFSSGG